MDRVADEVDGGEGVARAYDRIIDGTYVPVDPRVHSTLTEGADTYTLTTKDNLRRLDGDREWEVETWPERSSMPSNVHFVINEPALAGRSAGNSVELWRVAWVRSEINPQGQAMPIQGSEWAVAPIEPFAVPFRYESPPGQTEIVHIVPTVQLQPGLYTLRIAGARQARVGVNWNGIDQRQYSAMNCVDRYDRNTYRLCNAAVGAAPAPAGDPYNAGLTANASTGGLASLAPPQPAPAPVMLGLAAVIGVTVGIAGLTRYSFAWLIVPVAILGGLDSVPGAILGGLVIGVLENLSGGYLDPIFGFRDGFSEYVNCGVQTVYGTAAGQSLDAIARGDWLVHEAVHAPTQRIDARVHGPKRLLIAINSPRPELSRCRALVGQSVVLRSTLWHRLSAGSVIGPVPDPGRRSLPALVGHCKARRGLWGLCATRGASKSSTIFDAGRANMRLAGKVAKSRRRSEKRELGDHANPFLVPTYP